MSDNPAASFGKFVPGFEFLQSLAKGAAQGLPQMPQVGSWVAPTLSVEELDKRIAELKAVQFWLDQNATALKATIQALEVQKMTLATLKGMNLGMNELANAFQFAPMQAGAAPSARPAEKPADKAADKTPEPPPKAKASARPAKSAAAPAAPGVIDPLQWWGALTQQFQQIAATAMRESAAQGRPEGAAATPAPAPATARRAPARKAAGRKSAS